MREERGEGSPMKKYLTRAVPVLVAFAVMACATAPANPDNGAAELFAADTAFAEKSRRSTPAEAFALYMHEDGVQIPPTGDMPRGREAIRKAWNESAPTALHWTPKAAEVSQSGDLGWTWGEWEAFEPGAGGKRVAHGRYVNVWRRNASGVWKVVVDIGNTARGEAE